MPIQRLEGIALNLNPILTTRPKPVKGAFEGVIAIDKDVYRGSHE